jgi:D-inositol-3-phosphate glycosyltransferase
MPFIEPPPAEAVPMGRIDEPASQDMLPRAPVTFRGWALFPSDPTARVELWLGDHHLGLARLGLPRPDIGEATDSPAGVISGFDLVTDITDWPEEDGETFVRAFATSVAGERYEAAPIAVSVSANAPSARQRESRPIPPPSQTRRATSTTGLQVLFCTHQLNLGGAQLYLLDLLSELVRIGDVAPTVVSALDGELRETIEALGIPVHISSMVPTDDLSSHIGRVEELFTWASNRSFDLAFINTATALAFPGAEVADLLDIPTVWAIHESLTVSLLWPDFDMGIRRRAEAALANAATVIFEAAATQTLYESAVSPSSCITLPYGLDLAPIDAARESFNVTKARRSSGVAPDANVLLCVGTVEPRKAQVPLTQAFELVAGTHPNAHLLIVGGRDDIYSQTLEDYISESKHSDRISLIPTTPDVQRWYGIANALVCASDIESLPRTVLEAMAWETPVVATDVYGLPELIEDGVNGWLCRPRDIDALALALDKALNSTETERGRMGRTAREIVEVRHSLSMYGRKINDILKHHSAKRPTHPQ